MKRRIINASHLDLLAPPQVKKEGEREDSGGLHRALPNRASERERRRVEKKTAAAAAAAAGTTAGPRH